MLSRVVCSMNIGSVRSSGSAVFGNMPQAILTNGVRVYHYTIHPYKGFRFTLAPGLEHREGEDEFLFRAGVGYEFEIGRWSILPEFNIDFVDGEEALVYGVSFGYGF